MGLVDPVLDSAGSRRELLMKITKISVGNYSYSKYSAWLHKGIVGGSDLVLWVW